MTVLSNGRLHTLRLALHAQFERHTDELTTFTAHGRDPRHAGLDPQTAATVIDSTRQALADTTEALKRMADGTYGRCERCQVDIPVERLEVLPHARFCVPCQQAHRGYR
jgi:RNA polymerase-binding transcription factor DksA